MNQDNSTSKTKNSKLKRIFLSPPHMGGEEMRFIQDAFASNYIAPLGPQVDAFEREFSRYVGIEHCAALASGTAALHLMVHILGVGQGDEVMASSLTFIGSVSPVIFMGGTPVFVDSERDTWCMDPDLLEEELMACKKRGRLPKAVIPTDLYGQCCKLERILEICEPYGIPVVADSAEALGAKYKSRRKSGESKWLHVGAGAAAAVYSFNGNKIITTSGGGMLASDDRGLIDYARKLSQQAREDCIHYEHEEIGYNYRMSNILAAIGRGQLRILDDRVEAKHRIFRYYQEALNDLPGIEFMPEAPSGRSNRWLTVILIDPMEFGADRETVRMALERENIEARPVWKPMHLQPLFDPQISADCRTMEERKKYDPQITQISADYRTMKDGKIYDPQPPSPEGYGGPGITQISADLHGKKRFPCRVIGGGVAEDLFHRGLCLPSGTAMTDGDLARVVSVIRKCRRG